MIAFSLVTANIIAAITTQTVYAKKGSKKSESSTGGDGDNGGGGGSGDQSTTSKDDKNKDGSSGGSGHQSDSLQGNDNTNNQDQGTNDNQQQQQQQEIQNLNPQSTTPPPPPPIQSGEQQQQQQAEVDCKTKSNDPSCNPLSQQHKPEFPPVNNPPTTNTCPDGSTPNTDGKCQTTSTTALLQSQTNPDDSCLFHPEQDKCKPDPTTGQCPSGFNMNENGHCFPDKPCPKGFENHDNDETGTCYPISRIDCPNGFHQEGHMCVENHHDNNSGGNTRVIVKTKTETTIKNFIINLFPSLFNAPVGTTQPNVLLLVDTGQICAAAGDTACVVTQNQFKTFNLLTKLDATKTTWTISGQVQNIAKPAKTLSNIGVIVHFYDSKGGNVGGLQQVSVNPTALKASQIGLFNIKAPTSQMSGVPTFLRLEYVTK